MNDLAYRDKKSLELARKKFNKNPEKFWSEIANHFLWKKKWLNTLKFDFKEPEVKWFEGGKLNITENCLDRYVQTNPDKIAVIFEPNNPLEKSTKLSYKQLFEKVCLAANMLKSNGIKKGDRVCIYMPMVPEAAYAMLACTRIGAIHSVVFGGFSPEALKDRIKDASCRMVITADEGLRGGKKVPLKTNVDAALADCPSVDTVIVLERTGAAIDWTARRDIPYGASTRAASSDFEPVSMDSEAPLFILYTSGSTGKPKGVLHTTGGYLLQAASTFKYVFDYREGEVFWCTADVGWVTGHSYIVYGPLANGATTVMFEGIPTYPDGGRCWEVIDKHQINTFFTAPTAIRALHALGDDFVTRYSRKSLRIIGSVGEPINPEAWEWYHRVVGDSRCPIVDSWWQTETGGILISPQTGAIDLKPGSATKPFYGIKPVIVDKDGNVLKGEAQGRLCIAQSWPGQMRTVYGDHQRFFDTYFSRFPGKYFSGDGCKRDEKGYYWITGRVDDVIIVSGHNLGTAEIEGSIGRHPDVAEAAVVGYPHEIKGNSIYAFVTLRTGRKITEKTKSEIAKIVRADIGPHATPEKIQFTEGLPKTRSGKIMRRILRNIASDNVDNLGDISTLADPSVVESLVSERI